RVALEVVLGAELMIVAKIECDRCLVDDSAVAETGPDRIDAALKGAELRPGARVAGYLPVIKADDTQHEPFYTLKASPPLPMKFVPTLVVDRGVLEVKGEACRAAHLQLRRLIRPGERPARIDARTVQTEDRLEPLLPEARRRNVLQVNGVRERALLPSELNPGDDVFEPPAADVAEGRRG